MQNGSLVLCKNKKKYIPLGRKKCATLSTIYFIQHHGIQNAEVITQIKDLLKW